MAAKDMSPPNACACINTETMQISANAINPTRAPEFQGR